MRELSEGNCDKENTTRIVEIKTEPNSEDVVVRPTNEYDPKCHTHCRACKAPISYTEDWCNVCFAKFPQIATEGSKNLCKYNDHWTSLISIVSIPTKAI